MKRGLLSEDQVSRSPRCVPRYCGLYDCSTELANADKGNPSCCNLCLPEKLCILSACNINLGIKRSELASKLKI